MAHVRSVISEFRICIIKSKSNDIDMDGRDSNAVIFLGIGTA